LVAPQVAAIADQYNIEVKDQLASMVEGREVET
jgi:hypothetical protein